jgi:hypothetical protein
LVREKRVPPKATPEIVEFWSWLLPMVVVETKPPVPLDATSALGESDDTARFVVVAWVVVD